MATYDTKRRVAIVAGKRTPFDKAGTVIQDRTALELATHSVNGTIRAVGVDPAELSEIVLGAVLEVSGISYIARETALESALSPSTRAGVATALALEIHSS